MKARRKKEILCYITKGVAACSIDEQIEQLTNKLTLTAATRRKLDRLGVTLVPAVYFGEVVE